jgi:hypothetical protein
MIVTFDCRTFCGRMIGRHEIALMKPTRVGQLGLGLEVEVDLLVGRKRLALQELRRAGQGQIVRADGSRFGWLSRRWRSRRWSEVGGTVGGGGSVPRRYRPKRTRWSYITTGGGLAAALFCAAADADRCPVKRTAAAPYIMRFKVFIFGHRIW